MKVCKNCGYLSNKEEFCKKCKDRLEDVNSLSSQEASEVSEKLHSLDVVEYDKGQNALCFVVLGGISIVVGLLFIILSLQRKNNKIVGFNFASIQFIICVVCLSIGCISLGYGLYRFISTRLKRKQYKQVIEVLSKLKQKD
jgi:hypothetical protein